MTRIIFIAILSSASVAAVLVGQENPEKKQQTPIRQSPEEIVKRLNQSLEEAEGRLGKKDPREQTQKIQENIIHDLDELINQNNSNAAAGSSGENSSGKKNPSERGTSLNKASNSGKSANPNQYSSQSKDRKPQQENSNRNKPVGEPKRNENNAEGKEGKEGDGDGANKKPKAHDEPKRISIADLKHDPWGDLPPRKRQEMEVYGKERFLPKYEDLLRQYYRTISENDRRKEE